MEYQPGVCNIGPAERRKRLLLGVASLLVAGAFVAAVLTNDWPTWTLLLSVFPLYGAAMGVLQYRERFCVGFAGLGVFDADGRTDDVTDPQALEADRKRAVRLNAKALAYGAVATAVVYGAVRLLA